MGWMEFTAEMTKALAWPAGAVVVALVFRGQIKALFDREKGSMTVGPIGVAWEGLKREVSADIEAIEPTGVPAHMPTPVMGSALEDLADRAQDSPRAAIFEAFLRVDQALDALLDDHAPGIGFSQRVDAALHVGLITPRTASGLHGLAVMRNLAIHGSREEVTTERALEFLTLVDGLMYAIAEHA